MSAYADTSFLASLYVPDSNSAAAAALMRRVPLPLLMTVLGELELVNAIQLRLFRKEVLPPQARAARAAFRADVRDGILVVAPMSQAIYAQSRRMALKWTAKIGARTLDIIHVASALALEADSIATFDRRQLTLASAAGLGAL